MTEIPEEVQTYVTWKSGKTIPNERIRFTAKSSKSRGEAWAECPMPPKNTGERTRLNPWRKAHTMNYWAWYCVGEVPS